MLAGSGMRARWREPAGYAALSLALFMAWWAPLAQVISVEAAGNRAGVGAWLPVDALVGRVSGGVLTLMALGAAFATVRWSRHWGGPLSGFLAFWLLDAASGSIWHGHREYGHGVVLPSALALSWAWGRYRSPDDPARARRRAVDFCSGVAAALYGWSAISKVLGSGLSWAWSTNVPLLIFERTWGQGATWVHELATTMLPDVFAVVVISAELAGVTFIFPRWRAPIAVFMVIMHCMIGALIGYFYTEWWLTLVGLALLTRVDDAPVAVEA